MGIHHPGCAREDDGLLGLANFTAEALEFHYRHKTMALQAFKEIDLALPPKTSPQSRPSFVFHARNTDGVHIRADYRPPDEFVANNPFGTKNNIKLIVLAGFGGIGTLAAAKALVQDFRYLEPVGEEKCVYGIVEAKYRKSAHKDDRQFRSFRWRHRKGGHSPI